MSDFTEVLLLAAIATYLFEHANDWLLTGCIVFTLFCSSRFVYSAYRVAKLRMAVERRARQGRPQPIEKEETNRDEDVSEEES